MSDITFKQPVTVGSIVEFDAKVVLTHTDLMRVAVRAIKHEPVQSSGGGAGGHGPAPRAVTTTFSFLFAAPPGTAVPPVRPETEVDEADLAFALRQHAEDSYPPPPA